MSEKPQSTEPQTDVSRETSEPQETPIGAPAKPTFGFVGRGEAGERAELSAKPEAEQSVPCLDDIISKSIAEQEAARKRPDGDEPEPAPETPPEGEAPPPPPEKKPRLNKRTAVYRYLLVLFGAAFVLLLLAYFVQQRNSENTIDDMRNTMNLSRAELMEEIDGLKADKEALEQEKAALEKDKRWAEGREQDLKDEKEQAEARVDRVQRVYEFLLYRASIGNGLDLLERFNRAGDWLMSATIVEKLDQYFNEKHPSYDGQYTLPAQRERYLALRETVFDRGRCMVVEGDDTERPQLAEGAFEPLDILAAGDLLSVLLYYPVEPDFAAGFAAEYLQPDGKLMARLREGAFKRSTLALAEQVRDDLIEAGWLAQDEDGKLKLAERYGEDSERGRLVSAKPGTGAEPTG